MQLFQFLALAATIPGLALASACPFGYDKAAVVDYGVPAHPQGSRRSTPSTTKVDYDAVRADIRSVLINSQSFWPADFGNYGPLMIRLAWHCAGSHRDSDGRGGCDGARIRFTPERAWDDNTNLDKALHILQGVKDKHPEISWGDLIVLTGNTAIESMGGPKMGFCAGRSDDTDGSASTMLGPTPQQQQNQPCAVNGNCTTPFGPTTINLIYVNPEGPMGNPDPVATVATIRDTFGRMGFNDSETVAIIGGGHAFGKTHGACPTGPGPNPIQDPTNPWPGTCGTGPSMGKGNNTFTSGFEGVWTDTPTEWSNDYFTNLLDFTWVKFMGPGGHNQWKPSEQYAPNIRMLTADVALLHDPIYKELVKKFANSQEALNVAFAAGWYKLVTRDMGPQGRCINSDAPPAQPFQNPLPTPSKKTPDVAAVVAKIQSLLSTASATLEPDVLGNGQPYYGAQLIDLAFQCASSFRATDYRGGCNGARIRFSPEKDYPENAGLDKVLSFLEPVKATFGDDLSWADLIITAGATALSSAGVSGIKFSFGRSDALDGSQSNSFPLRNYYINADAQVVDDAAVRGLTAHQAVALAGRPRSLVQQKRRGVQGSYAPVSNTLSNEYYQILLRETWVPVAGTKLLTAKSNSSLVALDTDVALLNNAEFKAVVQEFAQNQTFFLASFAEAWSYLINADMEYVEKSASLLYHGSNGFKPGMAVCALVLSVAGFLLV
ncbi:UNVERIFIED_CONTAM: hypothetical protein HDU68_004133 [Siphonaria sp. JEL0065]|nr:hypothetical protein HDU68_004133 [Siphonaria sp. JEL0065]